MNELLFFLNLEHNQVTDKWFLAKISFTDSRKEKTKYSITKMLDMPFLSQTKSETKSFSFINQTKPRDFHSILSWS